MISKITNLFNDMRDAGFCRETDIENVIKKHISKKVDWEKVELLVNQAKEKGGMYKESGLSEIFLYARQPEENKGKPDFLIVFDGLVILLDHKSYKTHCPKYNSGLKGICPNQLVFHSSALLGNVLVVGNNINGVPEETWEKIKQERINLDEKCNALLPAGKRSVMRECVELDDEKVKELHQNKEKYFNEVIDNVGKLL